MLHEFSHHHGWTNDTVGYGVNRVRNAIARRNYGGAYLNADTFNLYIQAVAKEIQR